MRMRINLKHFFVREHNFYYKHTHTLFRYQRSSIVIRINLKFIHSTVFLCNYRLKLIKIIILARRASARHSKLESLAFKIIATVTLLKRTRLYRVNTFFSSISRCDSCADDDDDECLQFLNFINDTTNKIMTSCTATIK
jgi:hypothetical protein